MITVYQGNLTSLIQEEIEKDSSSFLGAEKSDPMSYEKFSVNSADSSETIEAVLGKVQESLKTSSVFTAKRIVQVNLGDLLEKEKLKGSKGKSVTALMNSLANVDANTCCYLIISSKWSPKKLEMPEKLFTIKSFFEDSQKKPLKIRALEKVRAAGKRIEERGLEEWINSNEDEDSFWDQFQQVLVRTGEEKEIKREYLEPYLNKDIDNNAFALSNALGKRDTAKVISLLNQSIELEGEVPQFFLARIINYFIQLKAVRNLIDRNPFQTERISRDRNGYLNLPDSFFKKYHDLARPGLEEEIMGKHPYALKGMFTAASSYSKGELEGWLKELYRVDKMMKSSSVDEKNMIEAALVRMTKRKSGKTV